MNEEPLGAARLRRWLAAFARTEAEQNPAERRSPLDTSQKLGLLVAFVLLVALRLPEATLHSRLLGEEGEIFLAYAWHREAWDAVWRSFGGYLNLAANASSLLAARLAQSGMLPLENLPRLTMGIALAFQALPAVLILWARGAWLTSRWAYAAALLMIGLAPFSEEVWLNVLHIQFHLTLCCALILAMAPPTTSKGMVAQGAILLLAPLCGPGALVLGPLFLARTLLDRSPGRLLQTAILGFGGVLQLALFFTPSPVRGEFVDLPSLASMIFLRLGALPVSGIANGWTVGEFAFQARSEGQLEWWAFSGLSMAFCGAIAVTAWRYRRSATGWLIAAGLSLAIVSFGGGMIALDASGWFGPSVAERYNFVPLVLLGLAVITIAQNSSKKGRLIAKILCAIILANGAIGYFYPIRELSHGPDWRSEVGQWRANHDYLLKGWPSKWRIDLSDRHRVCPEANYETASIEDPRYCESAWIAKLKMERSAADNE